MQKTWKAKCKRQCMYMKSFPHKCLLSIYCSRPTYWFHWLAGRGQHAAAVRWHLGFCCGDIECGHQFSYDETLLMLMLPGTVWPLLTWKTASRLCSERMRKRQFDGSSSTQGSFQIQIKTPSLATGNVRTNFISLNMNPNNLWRGHPIRTFVTTLCVPIL